MIYTWQFNYDENIDGFGEIQFCAKTKKEAIGLFNDWAKENNYEIKRCRISAVYNKADAEFYKDVYAMSGFAGVKCNVYNKDGTYRKRIDISKIKAGDYVKVVTIGLLEVIGTYFEDDINYMIPTIDGDYPSLLLF